jgi:hypothetical protein
MLTGTCHCGAVPWTLDGDAGSIAVCDSELCCR